MKISIKQGMFVNDMTDYIFDLKQATLRGKRLQEVDALGLKEFRRLIARIRWSAGLSTSCSPSSCAR